MSNGGAQLFCKQFVDANGDPVSGVKAYHYIAGTTTDKTVWTDEAKTSAAAQPVVGDSTGLVTFYADGLYRIDIKDSSDTLIKTLDNYRITSDTATLWEGDQGTAYPTAAAANRFQLFAKHDANNIVTEIGINDENGGVGVFAFRDIAEILLNILALTGPMGWSESGDEYIRIPRLTTGQRTALTDVNAMFVFDTTLLAYYFRSGSWKKALMEGANVADVEVDALTSDTHLLNTAIGGASTPDANRFYKDLMPKAWANFDGTGSVGAVTPRAAVNLTINKDATGLYTCTFRRNMADVNYVVCGIASGNAMLTLHDNAAGGADPTVSQFEIRVFDTVPNLIDKEFLMITVFGNQ
jgi:hypothetical protein